MGSKASKYGGFLTVWKRMPLQLPESVNEPTCIRWYIHGEMIRMGSTSIWGRADCRGGVVLFSVVGNNYSDPKREKMVPERRARPSGTPGSMTRERKNAGLFALVCPVSVEDAKQSLF